jgi:lipopolysaccharide transport system permease protein
MGNFFIKKNFELILEVTKANFKLRYNNNYFSYFWIILSPLLMLTTLFIVFSFVMKLDIQNYQAFLIIGIISWNYFSESTSLSISWLVSNSVYFKKHKINPLIIIFSASLTSLITLIINILILFSVLLAFNTRIYIENYLFLPYLLLFFVFTIGVSLIITSIYIHFKDISHVWSFILLLGFWISPIVYSETQVPAKFIRYYMFNPLARVISHLRNSLLYNYIDSIDQIIITLLLIIILFFIGLFMFDKLSQNIGEKI